jgi:hypothetical protein
VAWLDLNFNTKVRFYPAFALITLSGIELVLLAGGEKPRVGIRVLPLVLMKLQHDRIM